LHMAGNSELSSLIGAKREGALPDPRTIKYCAKCRMHTVHELQPTSMVCAQCAAIALEQQLDWD